jgi:hypothetical protein
VKSVAAAKASAARSASIVMGCYVR